MWLLPVYHPSSYWRCPLPVAVYGESGPGLELGSHEEGTQPPRACAGLGRLCQLQVREHGFSTSLFLKAQAPGQRCQLLVQGLQRLLPGERE